MNLSDKYKRRIYSIITDEKLNRLTVQFIKDESLIIYGGEAINATVIWKSEGRDSLYKEWDVKDYDVYSPHFQETANKFAELLLLHGYNDIKIVTGLGGATRKIIVGFDATAAILDVTEKKDFESTKTLEINGLLYVDPQYSKLDQYQNLTLNLYNDRFRMKKAFKKAQLLEKWFPPIQMLSEKPAFSESIRDIGYSQRELKEFESIWGGDEVYNYYYPDDVVPVDERHIYSNDLIPHKNIDIYLGILREPNYRIFPIYNTMFYRDVGAIGKIVTRLTLLYQYYHLHVHGGIDCYKKIVKLLNDPKTHGSSEEWKIYETVLPYIKKITPKMATKYISI